MVPVHSRRRRVLASDSPLVWYLGRRLSNGQSIPDDTLGYLAGLAGGVVVRGVVGAKQASNLRGQGFDGRLWLDPAEYDPRAGGRPSELFDPWAIRQDQMRAAQRISPGSLVGKDADVDDLRKAIDTERLWLIEHGSGRCTVAVHVTWLIDRAETLARMLAEVGGPLALIIAGGRDPLAMAGAVQGLVRVLRSGLDIFLLRGDLGALGALAHGATMAAFGTGASMRHFVPEGENPGRSTDRSPSVFVPGVLSFVKGAKLDQFPMAAKPCCPLPCCEDKSLGRFNVSETANEAMKHNLTAMADVAATVLSTPPGPRRAARFQQLCASAIAANSELENAARRELRLSPQVKAWSRIDPAPESALGTPVH